MIEHHTTSTRRLSRPIVHMSMWKYIVHLHCTFTCMHCKDVVTLILADMNMYGHDNILFFIPIGIDAQMACTELRQESATTDYVVQKSELEARL